MDYCTSFVLRGPCPRANYIDRATALSAKLVSTFADRGCRVVSAGDPQAVLLVF
jgi:hypothetical protein